MRQTTRVVIYARVSTNKQSCENQLIELRRIAETSGKTMVGEFVDEAISGSKARNDRPALVRLMKAATRREFDELMIWSIDRLGRSLQDLVEIMNELHHLGIDLFSHQQALDTTTPSGKLSFSIFGALAEYERSMIRERVIAGQQRARAQGTKLGRPTKLNDSVRSAVVCLREKGMSIAVIAKKLEIGVGTVYKCLPRTSVSLTGSANIDTFANQPTGGPYLRRSRTLDGHTAV